VRGIAGRFVAGPLTRAAISIGHLPLLAVGRTWTIRHVGRERVDRARRSPGCVLYVFTHGVLLPLAFTHRRRDVQVLISESRDGEVIARITQALGFGSVRGSSSRGGGRAIGGLTRRARQGYDLAITPDGPRGPRGSVSPGAWLVAGRSGVPIIPVGVAADRAWRLRSWDRFLVPKPGAWVWVVYGEAVRPDPAHKGEDHTDGCPRIETDLARVEEEADAYANGRARPLRPLRVAA
jgi:lysophospholipid acyltransferase (LPLAT)-like uncharacterized protein